MENEVLNNRNTVEKGVLTFLLVFSETYSRDLKPSHFYMSVPLYLFSLLRCRSTTVHYFRLRHFILRYRSLKSPVLTPPLLRL